MKLSIAIITYNQERFIAQAIESVVAQKVNFDYEILIGEDCSTDRTRAVVMDFQRRFPDRIVPQPREHNLGAQPNVAATLAACRGRYVAFLEGDDYWTSPDKLQKQVDFLDAHPDCAISCHRARFLYEPGSEDFAYRFDVFPLLAAGPYTIEDILKYNFVMTCSAVLRRDLIPPFPHWFSRMKLGDWPLFAMVARHGKIALMDEIMAAYRMHPGSVWSSLPTVSRLQEQTRMLRALDRELGFQYTNVIRETIASPYLGLALKARENGNRIETARHLFSCIRNGGLRLGKSPRIFAGLAAYILIGDGYKIFSRAKSANQN